MKLIKIDHEEIEKAVQSNIPYIQIGDRKFLLMEVNEVRTDEMYEVTDPEEEAQLLKALSEDNPIVPDDQISKLLGN